jgi:hypothetical protein
MTVPIEEVLASADVDWEQVEPGTWMAVLEGEHKRTVPVMLRLEDRSLQVRSLLCRTPDEAHEDVYRYLLTRNQRTGPVHFALDDDGNILIVGAVPRDVLDEDAVERLLGAVLVTADETYDAVLRRGFRGYIAHEQRWRAARGMPPNPVTGGGGEQPT